MNAHEKKQWKETRTRLFNDLIVGQNVRKQDLQLCFKLHKQEFDEPKVIGKITCCIEKDLWIERIGNLNKVYNKKTI